MRSDTRVVARPTAKPPAPRDADLLPPSYLAIFSVLFALAALYFSVRALAWAACFLLLSSLLTSRTSEFDRAQSTVSTVVTLSVLVVMYADPFAV